MTRMPLSARRMTHRMPALAILTLAVVLLCACSTITVGEEQPATPVGQIVPAKLAIVHTGGIGGSFAPEEGSMGVATVAGIVRDLESQGYETLLLDSGNSLVGSPLADLSYGEDAIGIMNAAGYDALAVGTGELSLGAASLRTRVSQSDFPYLSANLRMSDGTDALVEASQAFTLSDGRSVGVFGLTRTDGQAGLSPVAADDFSLSSQELAEIAQTQADELRSQGCQLVVCLGDLGVDGAGEPLARTIAAQTTGIDLVLDTGTADQSRQESDAKGQDGALVVETEGELAAATVVIWEHGSLTARKVGVGETVAPQEQVEALVNQSKAALDQRLSKVVATSKKALPAASGPDGPRLAQLAADALLWQAQRASGRTPDAAIVTRSALEEGLPAGRIALADALATLPHASSRICLVELSGASLQACLIPLLSGDSGGLGIGGIGLEDTEDEKDRPAAAPTALATVGNGDFSPDGSYTLACLESQLSAGAELCALAERGTLVGALEESGGTALASYLEHACHGKIPDSYLR